MNDLAFWEGFARAELILALEEEAGETLRPRIFETSQGAFALAFSSAADFADFAGAGAAYAGLPGRALAALLAPQGYGLALDPEGDARLLPAADLMWLTETLSAAPQAEAAAIGEVLPPGDVPESLASAIAARLGPGLFEALVIARTGQAGATPLVAVLGASDGAEAPLSAALSEALAFGGAGPEWQIGFFPATGTLAGALLRQGMRLEIAEAQPAAPDAPGSDPSRPPRLR